MFSLPHHIFQANWFSCCCYWLTSFLVWTQIEIEIVHQHKYFIHLISKCAKREKKNKFKTDLKNINKFWRAKKWTHTLRHSKVTQNKCEKSIFLCESQRSNIFVWTFQNINYLSSHLCIYFGNKNLPKSFSFTLSLLSLFLFYSSALPSAFVAVAATRGLTELESAEKEKKNKNKKDEAYSKRRTSKIKKDTRKQQHFEQNTNY